MADFVLVHGGWSGGWAFNRTREDLRAAGHRVLVAELAGLGVRRDEIAPGITLSDHVDDVCRQVEQAGFERFVLVGHSYGGAVVSGVATRLGGRIDALVYLDAFVLGDGQSIWDVVGEFERRHYIDTQKLRPGMVAPIVGGDAVDLGYHPLLTMLEAVGFTGEEAKVPRRLHIVAANLRQSPFRRIHDELVDEPGWELHEAACGHNVMKEWREQLLEILLDCVP